jgi:hypothetical protein
MGKRAPRQEDVVASFWREVATMKLALKHAAGYVIPESRLIGGREGSDVDVLFVVRHPFANPFVLINSLVVRSVIYRSSPIGLILRVGCEAEVRNTVVIFGAVYVIEPTGRPLAVGKKPYQPVCEIAPITDRANGKECEQYATEDAS